MTTPATANNAAARADISSLIAKIKTGDSSRERSLALTKLEEAQLWLDADTRNTEAKIPGNVGQKTTLQLAEEAHARFHAAGGGYPTLAWKHIGAKEQAQWIAAVSDQASPVAQFVEPPVTENPNGPSTVETITPTPEPTVTPTPTPEEEDEIAVGLY